MTDHRIAFWNLENLFAPEGFPDREPWIARSMASDLTGWTEELFNRKISQLTTIISQIGGSGPDVLGVCEVENRFVLDELTASLNAATTGRTYGVVHADNTFDRRGIDTAFVYDTTRFEVDPEAVFSHFVMRRTGTRDITQVTFTDSDGNEFVALANHWPSRSGGAIQSAGFRATAGETLAYWHERTREVRGADIPIIALGDLNDDPWDPSVLYNANASRERGDTERAQSARFHNLSWDYLRNDAVDHRGGERAIDGTLYYRNNGNVFDQILVNRSLLRGERGLTVIDETAGIEMIPAMVDHRVSHGPIRFGLPDGEPEENVNQDGFSDHFPVSVVIRTG
ncbi:MAG: endonuclease/exonuclease/phosphatase family protein [Actinomycetota bacterium]